MGRERKDMKVQVKIVKTHTEIAYVTLDVDNQHEALFEVNKLIDADELNAHWVRQRVHYHVTPQ